jgi:hypothetical protein
MQLENLAKMGVIGVGVGIGLAIAAPFIGGSDRERRKILKGVVRSCWDIQESVREKVAEAGERLSDLVAEVQAERAAADGATAGPTNIAAFKSRSAQSDAGAS